jgi:hypothetical protein
LTAHKFDVPQKHLLEVSAHDITAAGLTQGEDSSGDAIQNFPVTWSAAKEQGIRFSGCGSGLESLMPCSLAAG